jgi:uncharacterized protein YrrD
MPVHDARGKRVGVVDDVLIDQDIWEGLIVHMGTVPGRHVFVDAEEVAELRARGIVLTLTREELAERDEHPGRRKDPEEEPLEGRLHAWLRRAWDRLAGRR